MQPDDADLFPLLPGLLPPVSGTFQYTIPDLHGVNIEPKPQEGMAQGLVANLVPQPGDPVFVTEATPSEQTNSFINEVQPVVQFEHEQQLALWRPIIAWNNVVEQNVRNNLQRHIRIKPFQNHDEIFGAHTAFVKFALANGVPVFPMVFWNDMIQPMVQAAEQELRIINPDARVHTGAPLYNVGLCCFVLGDFDSAFRFFAEAGSEDEKSGRGSRFRILLGDHGLSHEVMIAPLQKNLFPLWAASYGEITNETLDGAEFVNLLNGLAKRAADAFQAVIALHRFHRNLAGTENEATQHIRVRAIAELLLVLESTLKQPTGANLHNLIVEILAGCPKAKRTFDGFQAEFLSRPAVIKSSTTATTNWMLSKARSRIAGTTSAAEKAGNVCYLMPWLRNSLMHEVDSQSDLYTDSTSAEEVAGWVLCAVRIARHFQDNTLAVLP